MWGAGLVLLLSAAVGACILIGKVSDSKLLALYVAITSSLAVFIYYTPDYLHLSVDPAKRSPSTRRRTLLSARHILKMRSCRNARFS